MKKWRFLLIMSIVVTWILLSPSAEIYFGINMPFVIINEQEFNLFGYNIPNEQQLGIMLFTGVAAMLPVRLIHLCMIKLSSKK